MSDILVDTSVWSVALRRRSKVSDTENIVRQKLNSILEAGHALIIGPIRQELLSGIKDKSQFKKLKTVLSTFPELKIEKDHYDQAASIYNKCRARGIQGSNTDFLICSIAISYDLAIFTIDKDFMLFQKIVNFKLKN